MDEGGELVVAVIADEGGELVVVVDEGGELVVAWDPLVQLAASTTTASNAAET